MQVISMVGQAAGVLGLLLVAGTSLAQPHPARMRREQSVTLSGDPSAPPLELRVAPEVATSVLFDAEIRPERLEVDRARVKILDTSARFLLLQPVTELGSDERVLLRVPYADGQEPAQVIFALVSRPTEMDTRIEVVRRTSSDSVCQARVEAALSPTRLAREGWLGVHGVSVRTLTNCEVVKEDPQFGCRGGLAYLADAWTLLRLDLSKIKTQARARPWRPRAGSLRTLQGNARWQARSVEMDPAELAPFQAGRVFVEFAASLELTGDSVLELGDGEGHIITVKLNATLEKQP